MSMSARERSVVLGISCVLMIPISLVCFACLCVAYLYQWHCHTAEDEMLANISKR